MVRRSVIAYNSSNFKGPVDSKDALQIFSRKEVAYHKAGKTGAILVDTISHSVQLKVF